MANLINQINVNERVDKFLFSGDFKLIAAWEESGKFDNGREWKNNNVKISNGNESMILTCDADSGIIDLQKDKIYTFFVNVDKYKKARIVGVFEKK